MSEKEKILYICSNLFPLNSGSAIYSYGNIDRFSEYFNLDLISFIQEEPSGAFFHALKYKINRFSWFFFEPKPLDVLYFALKNLVLFQKYSRRMADEVNLLLEKEHYKYIIFDGLLTFFLLKEVRRKNNEKIILIEHNIEYLNIREEITFAPSVMEKILKILLGFGLKNFEKKSLITADIVLFISDIDKINGENLTGKRILGFVLHPFFPFPQVKPENELTHISYNLLILGNMWWYPNVQGAIWFLSSVFPLIRAIDPRYRLFIVGKDPSANLLQYNSESVIITGSVSSVDEYIKKCDILIVPNILGGGIKIKIFEGIMKGIPVFARPESILGYPSDLFPEEYVSKDPKEFAQMVLFQNQNTEKKIEFIRHGKKCLMEHYNISQLVGILEDTLKNEEDRISGY